MKPEDLTLRDWLDVLGGTRRCLRCQPHDYSDADTLCEHVTARELVPEPRYAGVTTVPVGSSHPCSVGRGSWETMHAVRDPDDSEDPAIFYHPTREGARVEWQCQWAIGHTLVALFSTLSEWAQEGMDARIGGLPVSGCRATLTDECPDPNLRGMTGTLTVYKGRPAVELDRPIVWPKRDRHIAFAVLEYPSHVRPWQEGDRPPPGEQPECKAEVWCVACEAVHTAITFMDDFGHRIYRAECPPFVDGTEVKP